MRLFFAITLFTFTFGNNLYAQQGDSLWTRHFGGPGLDRPKALAIDAAGNLYLGVLSYSTNLSQYPSLGNGDIWIIKLDRGGNTMWMRYLGGSDAEDVGGIAVLNDGNIVV